MNGPDSALLLTSMTARFSWVAASTKVGRCSLLLELPPPPDVNLLLLSRSVSRRDRSASDVGIVLDSLLLEIAINVNLTNNPKEVGTSPVRAFVRSARVFKFVSWPRLVGMEEVKKLSSRSRDNKLVSWPIQVGMEEVRWFALRKKYCSFSKFPSKDGIVFDNLLCGRFKTVKLCNSPMLEGMVELKALCPKSKVVS